MHAAPRYFPETWQWSLTFPVSGEKKLSHRNHWFCLLKCSLSTSVIIIGQFFLIISFMFNASIPKNAKLHLNLCKWQGVQCNVHLNKQLDIHGNMLPIWYYMLCWICLDLDSTFLHLLEKLPNQRKYKNELGVEIYFLWTSKYHSHPPLEMKCFVDNDVNKVAYDCPIPFETKTLKLVSNNNQKNIYAPYILCEPKDDLNIE